MDIKGRRYCNRLQVHTYLDAVGVTILNELAESLGTSASKVLAAGLAALNQQTIELIISKQSTDIQIADVIAHQRAVNARLSSVIGGLDAN